MIHSDKTKYQKGRPRGFAEQEGGACGEGKRGRGRSETRTAYADLHGVLSKGNFRRSGLEERE